MPTIIARVRRSGKLPAASTQTAAERARLRYDDAPFWLGNTVRLVPYRSLVAVADR